MSVLIQGPRRDGRHVAVIDGCGLGRAVGPADDTVVANRGRPPEQRVRREHPRPEDRRLKRWEDTDWEQIVLLYDMLLHLAPSPVTRLHRAIAVRYATGARAAMAELDDLADLLGEYHLYHASRAELLRELGQPEQARAADQRALELTANPAEQAVLHQRLTWAGPSSRAG